jgi:hypothetical protein
VLLRSCNVIGDKLNRKPSEFVVRDKLSVTKATHVSLLSQSQSWIYELPTYQM